MKAFSFRSLFGISACLPFLTRGVLGQLAPLIDDETGIEFFANTIPDGPTVGGFTWGYALPPDAETVDADEYIGIIIGSRGPNGAGWAGISHGGGMPSSLLLMSWANDDEILTSFRFATGYDTPELYTGDAMISPIRSEITDTHFTLIYRCQGCFSWNHKGETGSRGTTAGALVIGWVQSTTTVDDPTDPNSEHIQHDNGMGLFGIPAGPAANAMYDEWTELAVDPEPTETSTPTVTPTPTVTGKPVPTDTFDYIVVGGGAGGLTISDRLSEAGKSVLLIEKGPPSTHRWGGRLGPSWLDGNDLTRFDVPGLCNQIWVDSAGIACTDIAVMAGCVLGGGTAVNAGLWWKPPHIDWDSNFPGGWRSGDMHGATNKVFSRIPGTDHPSVDGELYLAQGYDALGSTLANAGWKSVTANQAPNEKNKVFTRTPYMFSGGERGGPLATYLVSASQRSNFKLWTNTAVRRVTRTGGRITGVEVEAFAEGGYTGVVKVSDAVGRVILSAGTFGTPKILMRSGIGLEDSLQIVSDSSTDGDTMIGSDQWINLPVGQNLVDHVNTDILVSHPTVVFYDFYEAWDDPNPGDKAAYLDNRSGILAQSAPNIGPVIFQEINGKDGIKRQLQWTARVEGPSDAYPNTTMTMSQYLGRGQTSRGRANITPSLSMTVTENPHLQEQEDIDAVITGIENMLEALATNPELSVLSPPADVSVADFVNGLVNTPGARTANHWMGSCKIGEDDGRQGGTSVVDTNTKVYGTDNLFVVDASIFPGMVTTNPSALIMIAAERAAEKILALKVVNEVEQVS
ncbi:hypothetical protein AJ80_01924 [Polytolypa hystricis UAMH7299]|uniref:Glucose-methanol-choline oxidoreductase N-terminal domain-containing protein n=1 Tax=Polytolypa hystricis (strain UAMH7299) TaxID=1447883 RepID=A0A2B7YXP2_POLH7|nr:hypothetical protein AJ80_01924 [Polytolypa hystricis UAMH7299]